MTRSHLGTMPAGEAGLVGRAAILDLVREATEGQTDQRRHNLVTVVFRREGADTAVVWAYLMLTSNAGGSATVIATGFYTVTLQHIEGEWRIARVFVGLDTAVRRAGPRPRDGFGDRLVDPGGRFHMLGAAHVVIGVGRDLFHRFRT